MEWSVTLPKDAKVQLEHIWIDTQSFLDVKVEEQPRRMDGEDADSLDLPERLPIRSGIVVPFVLESAVEGYPDTHKMFMEKLEVNPKLVRYFVRQT